MFLLPLIFMGIYKWKKLKKSQYKCEFNLKKVFKSYFSPNIEYEEDEKECGARANFQVSDDKNDWWICGNHLDYLFPTVKTEVNQKDEKKLLLQRQWYYKKRYGIEKDGVPQKR